jgi:hypothetical protein
LYPPAAVCRAIYRLHPQLRVGWCGRSPYFEGETNPGAYTICQLYHISDVGSLDEPNTLNELWEIGWTTDEDGRETRARVDRGPLYNRNGGSTRDWDPLFRVPVWMMTLDGSWLAYDGQPLVNEDISNGRLEATLRRLLTKRLSTRI